MPNTQKRQAGIALLTVMVVLMLCALIVVTGARSGLLHDMMTGHQSDRLRAQVAAEALVRDAERDILGAGPDGLPCQATVDRQVMPGFVGCRQRGQDALPAAPYFPQSADEFDEARALVQVGAAIPCRDGICFPASLQALQHLEDALDRMRDVGARYGQYTRAGLPTSTTAGNPLLAMEPARGWYWVEAFRYELGPNSLASRQQLEPDPSRPFIYRITAVALGLRAGTRAVVKSVFVPHPAGQLP